jgi:hypothetical protein
MGQKIVRILAVVALVAGAPVLRGSSVPRADAGSHALRQPRLRSARGVSETIRLVDYLTQAPLACGGTYVIESWIQGTIKGSARTAGTARLAYKTLENGHKYWQARSTAHLTRGNQAIGVIKQWPDRRGDSDRFTFMAILFQNNGRTQASARCTVTVSNPH